ncbi:MAG: DHHA1 domain-containing protein, partial [Pseudomonadota bacterium]
ETETAQAIVAALVVEGARVEGLQAGQQGWAVLNQTPFYAEAGGQVGDHGAISAVDTGAHAAVTDTRRFAGGRLSAHLVAAAAPLAVGDAVIAEVDRARRSAIRANHSATHLLHEALRRALGPHVAQRGSLNAPDRLRFDFAHTKAVEPAELTAVEHAVNAMVRQDSPVETRVMTPAEAEAEGARALFGEKYGDEVRVVSMGRAEDGVGPRGDVYSLELCGGTHVARTGEIGTFALVSETASSAGVRRIEAVTGAEAMRLLRGRDMTLSAVEGLLKTQGTAVPDRVRALLEERRALQSEVADLKKKVALGGEAEAAARDVAGVPFLAQTLSGVSGKDLRGLIDAHKSRLGSGAILLIADTGGKAAVAAGVTQDLTSRISAVDLVRVAAETLGGKGGGGRPDMAQAGGADPSRAADAIAAAERLLAG